MKHLLLLTGLLVWIEQKSAQKKTAIFPADPEAGYVREGTESGAKRKRVPSKGETV